MLKNILLLYCLLFLFTIGKAQTLYFSVTGNVTNEANVPLSLGNVIALSLPDSFLLKGNTFIDGRFNLEGMSEKSFCLQITSLGYKKHMQRVDVQGSDPVVSIGTIQLRADTVTTLREVSIIERLPLFEQDGEKGCRALPKRITLL